MVGTRSRFAERFTAMVGIAPMAYVAEWRLQKAGAPRRDGCQREAVAAEVGYQTAAAFTHAFAQRFGKPPSEVAG